MQTVQTVLTDVRYTLKGLLRAPEFAAVAILSLAVGVGINSAVFSVFNAALLRPLPYSDPDRLAAISEMNVRKGSVMMTVSPPDLLTWRETARSLQMVAAYRFWEPTLTGVDQPEQLKGLRVTGDFLPMLGVLPVAGRTLIRDDETTRSRSVVISRDLWRRRFAMDPGVVGRTVLLNGESHSVVGVLPASLQVPSHDIDIWAPLNLDAERNDRAEHSLFVVARLAPGASFEQARSELRGLMVRHEAESGGDTAEIAPLRDWFVGATSRRVLWLLLGAVNLLLLAACANVGNLLLARGSGRARELMIRTAIGASRRRLIGQLVTESLTVAAIAGFFGVLLAMWSVRGMGAVLPEGSPYPISPGTVDWRVLLYTFAVSLGAGLIFGLLPAFKYSRTDIHAARVSTASTTFRLRGALLVTQTTLAVTLLAAAGLLGRTFLQIWRIDPGFSPAGVTAARITLPNAVPDDRKAAFFERVVAQLAEHPRVAAAGAVTHVPLSGSGNSGYITIEGREALSKDPSRRPGAARLIVTPGYFRALEIPVRRGRAFTDADNGFAARVAMVNESFARRYWGDEDPVGRRIKRGTPTAPFAWLTIVGVAADTQEVALGMPAQPTVYLPLAQSIEPSMTLVVRSDLGPGAAAAQIRAAARAADPNQPVAWIRSLDEILFGSIAGRWLPVLWMMIFAAAALGLATLGVYGVVSYAVEQRRREFGIRLALGAGRTSLIRLALRQGVRPALLGTLLGLVGASVLARVNTRVFADVPAFDTTTFVAVAVLLFAVAAAASYLPARRITSEDAALALRCE